MKPDSPGIRAEIDALAAEVVAIHEPLIAKLQGILDGLEGKSFGSFEENRTAMATIDDLMNRLSVRIACPKEGCGEAATLLCHLATTSKTGNWKFLHHDPGSGKQVMHLGATRLPKLILVPATKGGRRKQLRETASNRSAEPRRER